MTRSNRHIFDTIADVDLNLLKVFEAILAEGSVGKAADRLQVSQSATSHSLSRLREIVDDPLFERRGQGVQPTPKALEIAGPVLDVLQRLRVVMRRDTGSFDPDIERRRFTLDIPAGVDIAVAPDLARLSMTWPGITFRILTSRARNVLTELRFGHTSLAIDYDSLLEEGFRSELMVEDEFVVMSRKEHPALRHGVSLELFQLLPQVIVVLTRKDDSSPVTNRLKEAGINRNVQMIVSSMPSMSAVVASSDLIASTSLRIARLLSRQHAIEIHPLPFQMPPLAITMVWHEHFEADSGHIWMREKVRSIFQGI